MYQLVEQGRDFHLAEPSPPQDSEVILKNPKKTLTFSFFSFLLSSEIVSKFTEKCLNRAEN